MQSKIMTLLATSLLIFQFPINIHLDESAEEIYGDEESISDTDEQILIDSANLPLLHMPQNISQHRPQVYTNGFPVLAINKNEPINWDASTESLYWLRSNWQEGATLNVSNTSTIFELNDVNINVRGRGNSTWHGFGSTKRPIRFRFPDDDWRPMFDSGHAFRDWVLLANVIDLSHLRTFSAFYLGMLLDSMPFVPNSWFVHLYLDDDYRGVYQLVDEREATYGRGSLKLDEDPKISEYMIEFDVRVADGDEPVNSHWVQTPAGPFDIRYPDDSKLDDVDNPFAIYVDNFIINVHQAIHNGDESQIEAMININSFIDFYLIQELMKNIDVGFSSVFYQIRGQNERRRLYAGPLWDFDLSAGSANNYPDLWASDIDSPRGEWAATTNRWFKMLLNTPWFREKVQDRWLSVRDNEVVEMLDRLKYLALTFEEDFQRDNIRWPDHGRYAWTSPTVANLTTPMENAEFLLWWFSERIEWMNEWLGVSANRSVTINGGKKSGDFNPGTVVAIEAKAPDNGYRFRYWESDVEIEFADIADKATTFVMPARNVDVSAVFERVVSPIPPTLSQPRMTHNSLLLSGGILNVLGLAIAVKKKKKRSVYDG